MYQHKSTIYYHKKLHFKISKQKPIFKNNNTVFNLIMVFDLVCSKIKKRESRTKTKNIILFKKIELNCLD